MVKLSCRHCGAEVDSDEKARKCRNCGDLFPFECAVCLKHLRPPIPDFPVERYFNDEKQPLCADHYQRQCPECSRWFRADENPGFFMCSDCTAKREAAVVAPTDDDEIEAQPEDEIAPNLQTPAARSGCGAGMILMMIATSALLWDAGHAIFAAVSR